MTRVFLTLIITVFLFPISVRAQTNTTQSNQVVTKIGNPSGPPPVSEGAGSGFALNFNEQVGEVCGGKIQIPNLGCIESIIPELSKSRKGIIKDSVYSGLGFYQCVGLVQTVIDKKLPVGFAKELAAVSVPGYIFIPNNQINKVQPGDIVVWSQNPNSWAGHTAYVVQSIDDQSFRIVEANSDGRGNVRARSALYRGNYENYLVGWLRKK
ncbi:MAG: hypothetical protein US86_C0002G0020 [Candidatus Daviesbacteria bacterium GW2011_GWA2_38_24]|uniref:Peptidase C51 domain-containing protein n=1 Tax=Candidatus Daviesbacteria bacterium GW2011_GWA2_38_24 TaxID=1618422 RepID=A0A0G0JGS5_9BACT|nr:MAG: hypothetical protein US86_C0002G0020 [Candidatus Daviesbacteria bacterium GW2011_GWA2_38_24]KKQ79784.1 MAG: hypothetical protein UT01_C0028G0017 [Candidatus Daviesbacteria bacterium GW2011_GWA1_38_7]